MFIWGLYTPLYPSVSRGICTLIVNREYLPYLVLWQEHFSISPSLLRHTILNSNPATCPPLIWWSPATCLKRTSACIVQKFGAHYVARSQALQRSRTFLADAAFTAICSLVSELSAYLPNGRRHQRVWKPAVYAGYFLLYSSHLAHLRRKDVVWLCKDVAVALLGRVDLAMCAVPSFVGRCMALYVALRSEPYMSSAKSNHYQLDAPNPLLDSKLSNRSVDSGFVFTLWRRRRRPRNPARPSTSLLTAGKGTCTARARRNPPSNPLVREDAEQE